MSVKTGLFVFEQWIEWYKICFFYELLIPGHAVCVSEQKLYFQNFLLLAPSFVFWSCWCNKETKCEQHCFAFLHKHEQKTKMGTCFERRHFD